MKFTYRVHRFDTDNQGKKKVDSNNEYFIEEVEADTQEEAWHIVKAKHTAGDQDARIFLKKVG